MIPRAVVAAAAICGLASASAGYASECEVGLRPGSTLLFPYFEVDLTSPVGLTTLISINSAATVSTLARVVVWTDWAVPVLAFDLALAAHDVQTINLRDLINGAIPSTSVPDLWNFAACGTLPPANYLTPSQILLLEARLTGRTISPSWGCMGADYGDRHARGYITVDTTNRCLGLSINEAYGVAGAPTNGDYFTTQAIVQNVLWGDMLYVDPEQNSAQGIEAVAIRAGLQIGNPVSTFYGRYVAWNGSDQRAPLPSVWTTRFLNGGAFDGGTDLIVFRDTRTPSGLGTCDRKPLWYPLVSQYATIRDETGNVMQALGNNIAFPLATQKVPMSSLSDFGTSPGPTTDFGQVELGLGFSVGVRAGAWVIPIMTASGRFSVDFNAQPIDSTCGSPQ